MSIQVWIFEFPFTKNLFGKLISREWMPRYILLLNETITHGGLIGELLLRYATCWWIKSRWWRW